MKQTYLIAFLLLILNSFGCKKFLSEKATKEQFIPNTIEDLQALLDNGNINTCAPSLLGICSDEYYVSTQTWESIQAFTPDNSSNYIWSLNAIPNENSWVLPYQQPIYYSNIVLDNLSSVSNVDQSRIREIEGAALFLRSFSLMDLAQVYCKPLLPSTQNELGLVLRLNSNPNIKSTRSKLKETYDRILEDLKKSAEYLPNSTSFPTQPNKAAAYGALARGFLNTFDYENAEKYSSLCLSMRSELIDFNTLFPLQNPRFNVFNKEVIFHSTLSNAPILSNTNAIVDTLLLQLYPANDLRKKVLFTELMPGQYSFVGSYNGTNDPGSVFNGLTTSEMYLIRAECRARKGQIELSMQDLNKINEFRSSNDGTWIPISASSNNEAVNRILLERRKELVFRGLRFFDLKRLNIEGANIELKRQVGGKIYTLPPNDVRWLLQLPFEVINRSGIEQNPR